MISRARVRVYPKAPPLLLFCGPKRHQIEINLRELRYCSGRSSYCHCGVSLGHLRRGAHPSRLETIPKAAALNSSAPQSLLL
jgi:hypothetical protein